MALLTVLRFGTPRALRRRMYFFVHDDSAKDDGASGDTASARQYVITGDTLFLGQCGRTDLPTGSDSEMFASLKRLEGFGRQNPSAIVLPGHHYSPECAALFETELKSNAALCAKTVAELAALP